MLRIAQIAIISSANGIVHLFATCAVSLLHLLLLFSCSINFVLPFSLCESLILESISFIFFRLFYLRWLDVPYGLVILVNLLSSLFVPHDISVFRILCSFNLTGYSKICFPPVIHVVFLHLCSQSGSLFFFFIDCKTNWNLIFVVKALWSCEIKLLFRKVQKWACI